MRTPDHKKRHLLPREQVPIQGKSFPEGKRKEREVPMWRPGIAEIIIVLVIIILLFGPGRISRIARELGASISAFKEGLSGENKAASAEKTAAEDENKEP